jgi:hypothetical protein
MNAKWQVEVRIYYIYLPHPIKYDFRSLIGGQKPFTDT